MIPPAHGGVLINRLVTGTERETLLASASTLPRSSFSRPLGTPLVLAPTPDSVGITS